MRLDNRPSVPTNPKITLDKSALTLGDSISITPTATNAGSYEISIWLGAFETGEKVYSKLDFTGSATYRPEKAGTYTIRMDAISSGGRSAGYVSTEATFEAKQKVESHYVDLNGYLDGVNTGNILGYGTADIYINGNLAADDVTDYYVQWPTGTRYEIKDIKAKDGYIYNGVEQGSLSGTIGTSGVNIQLSFSKKQHTHTLAYTPAKAATCIEGGNLAYWYCESCGKYFSDSAAANETTLAAVTLAAGHTYSADGICTVCWNADPSMERNDPHFEKQTLYFQDQFTDVPANQWFSNNVSEAYALGLMKGNSDTTFNPYGDVTLAEAITMAARIHSIYTTGTESFVQSGKWYQVYLDYAYNNGIISRAYYNANVENKATRAQFAEIFANALPDEALYPMNTIADNAIPDVSVSETYAPYVYKLYRAGILTGGNALGTFSPLTYITRAEAAAIVSRMAESNNRVHFSL